MLNIVLSPIYVFTENHMAPIHINNNNAKLLRTQEYYYVHRTTGPPLGKLYYKYSNWCSNLRNKSTEKSSEPKAKRSKVKSFAYEESETEQGHMRALKFENLTFDEKMMHWKGCVATRINSINKDETPNSKSITEMWPMYKERSGYRMVKFSCTIFAYFIPYTLTLLIYVLVGRI